MVHTVHTRSVMDREEPLLPTLCNSLSGIVALGLLALYRTSLDIWIHFTAAVESKVAEQPSSTQSQERLKEKKKLDNFVCRNLRIDTGHDFLYAAIKSGFGYPVMKSYIHLYSFVEKCAMVENESF